MGPFLPNEKITDADVKTMDRYMLRAWVEISLYKFELDRDNGELVADGNRHTLTAQV